MKDKISAVELMSAVTLPCDIYQSGETFDGKVILPVCETYNCIICKTAEWRV